MFGGQIAISNDLYKDHYDRVKTFEEWLNRIDSYNQEWERELDDLIYMPKDLRPQLDNPKFAKIGPGIRFPLPTQFKHTFNRDLSNTAYSFVAVPDDQKETFDITNSLVGVFLVTLKDISPSADYKKMEEGYAILLEEEKIKFLARACGYILQNKEDPYNWLGFYTVFYHNDAVISIGKPGRGGENDLHLFMPAIIARGTNINFLAFRYDFSGFNNAPNREEAAYEARRMTHYWLSHVLLDMDESMNLRPEFRRMKPEGSFYSHYDSVSDVGFDSYADYNKDHPFDILVDKELSDVVDEDYEYYEIIKTFHSFVNEDDIYRDARHEMKLLHKRIVEADDSFYYNLDEKAEEMQDQYRVSVAPDIYDEIRQVTTQMFKSEFEFSADYFDTLEDSHTIRTYMLHALRSFAWTLAEYCAANNLQPGDTDLLTLRQIISFAASHNWLNYDAETHCLGLCGGGDLYIHYLPDDISRSDREKIAHVREHRDSTTIPKESIRESESIAPEIHSLNSLRMDLTYIYPAILKLWKYIKNKAKAMEASEENETIIVYTWIAMAIAAKDPFVLTESSTITPRVSIPLSESTDLAFESNTGYSTNTFSENTHVPEGEYDIDAFGTLIHYKGNGGAITLPLGITAIGEEAFIVNKKITSVVIPEGVETIGDEAFWHCENLKYTTLPSTIRTLGEKAFYGTSLKFIAIPDGCEEIGADCFTFSESLKDIYVPASVFEIGVDAFCTFNDDMVIHTIRGSTADYFARGHGYKVEYDYDSCSDRMEKSYDAKATKKSWSECEIDASGNLTHYHGSGKIIHEGLTNPGNVYTVSQGKSGMIGVYRLESQMLPGSGKFERTGIGGERDAREATNAAFNYLKASGNQISKAISTTTKDYIINYQDLNGIGMTKRLTLPTVIAISSIALNKPLLSSIAILGEISIGGTIMKVENLASVLQVCLDAGAKKVLIPTVSAQDIGSVPSHIVGAFSLIFYATPQEAVFKALGMK